MADLDQTAAGSDPRDANLWHTVGRVGMDATKLLVPELDPFRLTRWRGGLMQQKTQASVAGLGEFGSYPRSPSGRSVLKICT